jgi:parallel beta-helix repeat protein
MGRLLSKFAALIALVIVIVVSISFAAFNVKKVEASGTIYIRANGLVEGTDKIITADNLTYTFIDNIYDSIVVERNNITIEGNGYILQGSGTGNGFTLSRIGNVTIRSTNIKSFWVGIGLDSSSNNSIYRNNVTENEYGILVTSESSYNRIFGNNIKENYDLGMWLAWSSNNVLWNNSIQNNDYNFGVEGESLLHFFNSVDPSNTVNSKPIYYWVNRQNMTIPTNAGYVALINCTQVTVQNLNLAHNDQGILLAYTTNSTIDKSNITDNYLGVRVYHSSNNTISKNNITANGYDGFFIESSNYNNIFGNLVKGNYHGIELYQSSNNVIFHNNFIKNPIQACVFAGWGEIDAWDDGYPSGGNYWSDYDGTDSDYDGIGDIPYFLGTDNQDDYPLMGMFSSFNTSYGYAVDFVSNSSVSDVSFDLSPIEVYPPEATLAFNVSGVTDSEGFVRVCIPKILINSSYVVRFNGEIITDTTYPQVKELPCSDATYTYFYINYTHSEHVIEISGITAIPEFPSFLILTLFMIATLIAVVVYRRKQAR